MLINFKFWYNNGEEEEIVREVEYIPDQILYKDIWWQKGNACYDFDSGNYTKVHYKQMT